MAVNYNGMNIAAKNLCVSLLRKAGRSSEAIALAKAVQKFDPLNYYSAAELVKLGAMNTAQFRQLLRGVPESWLDLAVEYFNNGFTAEGVEALKTSEGILPYPTVEYYLGYIADIDGDKAAASEWFAKAASARTDYVYPFRLETARPLAKALEYMPGNAVTLYYLGNLWFQKRPELAREYWEKAAESAPGFAMVQRNLGWYWKYKDEYHTKDVKYLYEKGLSLCKLGRKAEARLLYRHIVKVGKSQVTSHYNTFFESFDRGPFERDINSDAYYTRAVGYKALGRNFKARRFFKKALRERCDNFWANWYLD